jgi:hypothetical protein
MAAKLSGREDGESKNGQSNRPVRQAHGDGLAIESRKTYSSSVCSLARMGRPIESRETNSSTRAPAKR